MTAESGNVKDACRIYGSEPYSVVVVHGGPGAAGEMSGVAGCLSTNFGVVEPLLSSHSIEGQLNELIHHFETRCGNRKATLIGHSWGAWLSFILSAERPELVSKLVLIGAGPFESKYSGNITATRLSRLEPEEAVELRDLMTFLNLPHHGTGETREIARLDALMSKADSFSASDRSEATGFDFDVYRNVWPEAAALRESGRLLEMGRNIICPVTAIHGDYDPHPAAGVAIPLTDTLHNFKFILLKNCGHYPWRETEAAERFYEILFDEITAASTIPDKR